MRKNNSRGFTLIELMAVITILVILSLIIIPVVDKRVKDSKDDMYNVQIENIRMAGKSYFSDNSDLIPANSGYYISVKLSELIANGYLSGDVKNPKTGNNFSDDFDEEVYVQLYNDAGKYLYSVCPIEDDCESYSPTLVIISGFRRVKDVNPGVICGEGINEDYENSDVCYIYSIEDLVEFSSMVNNSYSFANKKVMLMNSLNFSLAKSYVNPNDNSFGDINLDNISSSLKDELTIRDGKGFPVIGDDSNPFMGIFEGNGNTISNLYINDSSRNYVGFFGSNSGWIRGLNIVDSYVSGYDNVGIISGKNSGSITSLNVSGNVNAHNYGGLGVGTNDSIVETLVSGDITSTGNYIGGVVGNNKSSGRVYGAYISGKMNSTSSSSINTFIGGGYNTSCYGIVSNSVMIKGKNASGTGLVSYTGFAVSDAAINDISNIDNVVDTSIGGDGNSYIASDGYYYDYDQNGNFLVYSIIDNPLNITMRGNGTVNNPYLISNYDEFKQASYNPSLNYSLVNDIDFTGKLPVSLGTSMNHFTGSFEGNANTISNFTSSGCDYVGLFGYNEGNIRGLTVINSSVSGNDYVGILAGANTGNMTSIKISGNASGKSQVALVSGLNNGIIEVVASGNVVATDSYVAGIVGYNSGSSKVYAIYTSGSVSRVGSTSNPSFIVGGGYSNCIAFVSSSVLLNNNTVSSTSVSGSNGFSIPADNIKDISVLDYAVDSYINGDSFAYLNNEKVSDGYYYDYDSNGDIVVRSISKNPLVITMEGSGTVEDPHLIGSYDDFKQASYDLSLNYKLVNDIDFTDKLPLILGSNNNHFTGNFEGDGYIISNVNLVGYNYVGLFGYSDGTIHGLSILDSEASGYQYVGVLAGTSKGRVTSAKVSGDASGYSYIGVALGENYSIIEAVVSGDAVSTSSSVGGVVGYNGSNAKIYSVYTSGSVTRVGGTSGVNAILGQGNPGGNSIVSKSVLVSGNACNGTSPTYSSGLAIDSSNINNIAALDYVIDTYIGRDGFVYLNNDRVSDGYYYDLDSNGEIVVRSISRDPLVVSMNGSGTVEDPYLINSYDDFKQASYDLSLNYKLVNNIDFNDKLPLILGSNNNHFTGNFEGNGYTISNFNLVGYNEVGLFGYSTGTIHGLTILDGEVSGYQHVGVLAGTSKGKVTGTKISGNVSGHSYIGVALGENYSIIEAVVSGDVVSSNYPAGGVVGYNGSNAKIYSVYTSGSVTRVGGTSGVNAIFGQGNTGGNSIVSKSVLVSGNACNGTSPTSNSGLAIDSSNINNIAYLDYVIDTYVNSDGYVYLNKLTESDGYYYDLDSNGDIVVRSISRNPLVVSMNGSGTVEDPYLINCYDDFRQASYNLSLNYKLVNNIDFNNKVPLILGSNNNHFTGVFDGNAYTISNVNLIGYDYVGLFGYNEGTIKGLKITNSNVVGNNNDGIVVGYNSGTISDLYVSGNVTGNSNVGLVSGYNNSSKKIRAVVSGNVTCSNGSCGGVSGRNYGVLDAAYISGSITYSGSGVYRIVGVNGATIHAIANNNITLNGSTVSNTSLTSGNGKDYTSDLLLTSDPYQSVNFNFTETDSSINEYIWYFDNNNLTFRRN